MADKSSRRDLISGLLDDQLTSQERVEAEALLRESGNDQMLAELKNQSKQLQGLPKFHLGSGFADQLLAKAEVNDVFSGIDNAAVSLAAGERRSTKDSGRFGGAIAAIASLAALVLVTLFVPQPVLKRTNVAQALPKTAADSNWNRENKMDSSTDSLPTNMDEAGVKAQFEDKPSNEEGMGVNEFTDSSKSTELYPLGVAGRGNQVLEIELAEAEPMRDQIEIQKRDGPTDQVAGTRGLNDIRTGGVPGRSRKSLSPAAADVDFADDELKSRVAGSRGRGQGLDSQTFELAPGVVSRDNNLVPLRKHAFESASASEGVDNAVGHSEASQRPTASLGIRGIVSVNFDAGTEMLAAFKGSLQRNSFNLELVEGEKDVQAGSLEVWFGRGLNNTINESEAVFEITATPKQVARLVKDLEQNATVLSLASQGIDEESRILLERFKQVESLARPATRSGDQTESNERTLPQVPFVKGVTPEKFSTAASTERRDESQMGRANFLGEQGGDSLARYLFIVRMNGTKIPAGESLFPAAEKNR